MNNLNKGGDKMENFKTIINEMGFKDRIRENLKKNFEEAKSDIVFKKLVESVKMDKSKLINYTSCFQDCAIEYKNCQKCKSLLACKNKIQGYVYYPQNIEGNLEFNYVACKYQLKFKEHTKYLDNISLFSITKDIKDARMKDIYIDDKNRFQAIKYAKEFINDYLKNNHPKGMYLHGSFGSGKTYIVSAILNELAKDNVKSAIVFWPEFLRELKSSFGTTFQEKFNLVKKAPILFIDDIGAESVTAWSRDEVLGPILQYRMQDNLPTFITSNLSIKDLEEHLSITSTNVDSVKARRIIERVKHLTEEVEMISKNLR